MAGIVGCIRGIKVVGDAYIGDMPSRDEPVQGGCHVKFVVVDVHGVQVVVSLRAEQRPIEVVKRRVQQDEVEAVADIEVACKIIVIQEEVGERAEAVGRAQV